MEWIKAFIEYLTAERGYSVQTTRKYQADLLQLYDFFKSLDEQLDWTSIDTDIIRQWMAARMDKGIEPRTIKRAMSSFRSFYRYLMRTGKVEKDIMLRVSNPKVGKVLPTFVKPTEMNRLLDDFLLPEGFAGIRDRFVVLLLYSTGIRRGEIFGLNVTDVHLDAKEIKVTGKRNKQRLVPMGQELIRELETYLQVRNETFGEANPALILNDKGERASENFIYKVVHDALSLITTQKKRSPHVLRHTFASALLNNGADLVAIKEMLGHESVSTTQVYLHTTYAELEKTYKNAHPRA